MISMMKNLVSLSLPLIGALISAACDSDHLVGEDPTRRGPDALGLQIEYVVASLDSEYPCHAGRIASFDDVSSCSCDVTAYVCDSTPALGGPCPCDAECLEARPRIQCADYSITFRIRNATGKMIERMSRIRVTVGELELKAGGLECSYEPWSTPDGEATPIIKLDVSYDPSNGNAPYAVPSLGYPCGGPSDGSGEEPRSPGIANPTWGARFGRPLPPAVGLGTDVLVVVEGLLQDGSAWKLEAVTQLR